MIIFVKLPVSENLLPKNEVKLPEMADGGNLMRKNLTQQPKYHSACCILNKSRPEALSIKTSSTENYVMVAVEIFDRQAGNGSIAASCAVWGGLPFTAHL